MANTPLHRPQPLTATGALPVGQGTSAAQAAEWLLAGRQLMVQGSYRAGLDVLDLLLERLNPPSETAGYQARRRFREVWRDCSRRLLAPILDRRVDLIDAPEIGFLADLYPDHADFALPLVDVRRLRAAWKLHRDGVQMPVLGHALHPFYGTYAPTRMTHLELFATWLSQYRGARGCAVDVGTGCGVLALMLCRAGFETVLATDSNPNAIESVRRELVPLSSAAGRIELVHGDLLGPASSPDLVVFNPPWVPGRVESPLDAALYYQGDLFERFFDRTLEVLPPEGRVVIIFSNLIELVRPDAPHPLRTELARGRFTEVQTLRRRVRGPRKTRERVEVWELRATTPSPPRSPGG